MTSQRFLRARVITWVAIGLFSPFSVDYAHAQNEGKETGTMKTQPRTISVRGIGKISAKPDSVHIQVGVSSEATTALAALAANNESMNVCSRSSRMEGLPRRISRLPKSR